MTGATAADVAAALVPDPTAEVAPPRERAPAEAPPHEEPESQPIRGSDVGSDHDRGIGLGASADAWAAVIGDVVRLDVRATYQRLRSELELGDVEPVHAYGQIHKAMDRAERNYHDAVLLSRAAKLEQERIDREVQARLEILRTTARKELEQEKRGALPEKSKASPRATSEEVLDRVRSGWPDEFTARQRETEEMHAARASCEGLVAAWSSRAQTLRKMAERYVRNGG
jgi:hypothetical protein